MSAFPSITDQVAEHLRQGMQEGRWRGRLPGRKRIAEALGCSQWTVDEATQRLIKEGMLVPQGAGRRHQIVISENMDEPRSLRLMILLYEDCDRETGYTVELIHRLQDAGHEASFAEKTMHGLGMNPKRIARYVDGTEADAWLVMTGSQDVLEWFAGQKTPTFALFGRLAEVPLASVKPDKGPAMLQLVDQLVDLGHRRIVMLAREERRKPSPGLLEQLFLNRLQERGISTGTYNLPDWGDTPDEFHQMLDSLFQYTAPTALIVDQPVLCVAVLQHLSSLEIKAPRDVSIACTDLSESFAWCVPSITHITWDSRPFINRVLRWADNISRGKDDRRKSSTKARLVLGGTIGPAREG